MTPAELVIAIESAGGTFSLEDGGLRCRAPKGAVSAKVAAALCEQKTLIAERWAALPADCFCHGACVQLGPCERAQAGYPCRVIEEERAA